MAPSIASISISIGNYLFYCQSRSHHLIQMILLFTSAHKYTVKMSVIIFDNSPFMTTPTWMNVLYNKLLLLGSKYSLNLIKFWINVSFFSSQGVEATVFLLVICLSSQVLNKSFFLPLIGTGEEIRSQYQQLAQVQQFKAVLYLLTEWEGQMVNKPSVCDITGSQIFSCVAQPFSVNKYFII